MRDSPSSKSASAVARGYGGPSTTEAMRRSANLCRFVQIYAKEGDTELFAATIGSDECWEYGTRKKPEYAIISHGREKRSVVRGKKLLRFNQI